MKVLVLGSMGQLGRCLQDQFLNTPFEVTFLDRMDLDINRHDLVRKKINFLSPDVVINATAYTKVDDAESEVEEANLINHLSVKNISKICKELKSLLIHISTDYVFDGNSDTPYIETDKTNPQNIYGISKLKGELALQLSGCSYIIIRTGWVFSEYGKNFLKTMIRLGRVRKELDVIGDQIGCPTYAQDLALAIVEINKKINLKTHYCEIYHYCGNKSTTWFRFANAIFKQAKIRNFPVPNVVRSIDAVKYPTPAKRPFFSVLNCKKITRDFQIVPSDWENGIITTLERL